MRVMYEPKGRAREYAPLALNLYNGCTHGCGYCYAPACLRLHRSAYHAAAMPRADVLAKLELDVASMQGAGIAGPVFLCFSCDPYPRDTDCATTRAAIRILGEGGLRVRLLTKNPESASLDFDLMRLYGVEYGVSLVWENDDLRREWEPGAGSVASRLLSLHTARKIGLRTWMSVEPVIDPDEALRAVHLAGGICDTFKVGSWNHDRRAKGIDYAGFLDELMPVLATLRDRHGSGWLIKDDLWAHATEAIRGRYARCAQ